MPIVHDQYGPYEIFFVRTTYIELLFGITSINMTHHTIHFSIISTDTFDFLVSFQWIVYFRLSDVEQWIVEDFDE